MKTGDSKIKRPINYVNAGFLIGSPVISILGLALLALTDTFQMKTFILAGVMLVLTGISITAGYHRLFSHKAFNSSWPVRLFFLLFGAASFQNSALKWCSDHRRHHKFTDTDRDPYNIKEGFWYAHWGWVFYKAPDIRFEDDVKDLCDDPLVRFQHKYYLLLGILVGFGLPVAIASFWGDGLGALIIAGFLRIVLNHHFTFAINSFAHQFGRQPFSDDDSSKDNWVLSLFTYGEGYHNFHHRFPWDYRNGIRWFDWDPSKWVIQLLARIRQADNLRTASKFVILRARLQMDEKRLLAHVGDKKGFVTLETKRVLTAARIQYEKAYEHLHSLHLNWNKTKSTAVQERLDVMRSDLTAARNWVRESSAKWKKSNQLLLASAELEPF